MLMDLEQAEEVSSPQKQATDSCLSLFQSSITSPSNTSSAFQRDQARRLEYRNRLQSFHSATYFAKPCCLSPILVARFGWRNMKKDVLQCDECHAIVAIVVNPRLSKNGSDRLIAWYQTQMADVHKVSCPFRRMAQQYFCGNNKNNNNKKTDNDTTLTNVRPRQHVTTFSSFTVLASVLPIQEVELLEHVRPTIRVRTLVEQLLSMAGSSNLNSYMNDVPSHIASVLMIHQTEGADTNSNNHSINSVLTRILNHLVPEQERQERIGTDEAAWETSLLLVLFGWRAHPPPEAHSVSQVVEETTQNQPTTARADRKLHCPLCLATLDFPTNFNNNNVPSSSSARAHSEASDGGATPEENCAVEETPTPKSSKRRRTKAQVGPWNAHRYYCPYMCGFPQPLATTTTSSSSKPVWRDMVDKLLLLSSDDDVRTWHKTRETNMVNEDAGGAAEESDEVKEEPSPWVRVHQMLMQGLAHKPRITSNK
ncbi:hypothetical protein ACA910_000712 [Epithemia clementina (nom. ined.)]